MAPPIRALHVTEGRQAAHTQRASVQDIGVDHGGFDVAVAD